MKKPKHTRIAETPEIDETPEVAFSQFFPPTHLTKPILIHSQSA